MVSGINDTNLNYIFANWLYPTGAIENWTEEKNKYKYLNKMWIILLLCVYVQFTICRVLMDLV